VEKKLELEFVRYTCKLCETCIISKSLLLVGISPITRSWLEIFFQDVICHRSFPNCSSEQNSNLLNWNFTKKKHKPFLQIPSLRHINTSIHAKKLHRKAEITAKPPLNKLRNTVSGYHHWHSPLDSIGRARSTPKKVQVVVVAHQHTA
jgi:hypothetical protein